MAQAKKSAIQEILEDETAGRLDFLHARTLAYGIAGEMEKLDKLVKGAVETHKSSRSPQARTRAALCAGVGLWIERKYDDACKELKPVANHPDGAYFIALCQTELARCDAAVQSFKKAAKAGQDPFVCGMGEVEALRRAGKPDAAWARLKDFQKSHKDEAELHYQKGRLADDALQYEEAMEHYEVAVDQNPQHVGALFRLAYLNDLRGNDHLAIDYYEKAAAVRPIRRNVLLNLGILYEDLGHYEQAANVYERVLAVLPADAKARMFTKDALASMDMIHDESRERRELRQAALLRTPLAEFELSARGRSLLEKMEVRTLGDLARLTEEEVKSSKNFGDTSLAELHALLDAKGLHFGYGRDIPHAPAAAPAPDQSDTLATLVGNLDLSIRSEKAMATLGVQTVGDLIQKTEKDLLACQNFGQTSLAELKRKLAERGFALKPKEE